MTDGLSTIRKAGVAAICALLACVIVSGAIARDNSASSTKTSSEHSSSTTKKASSKKRSRKKKSARVRGQQKIDSERALAIQQALIREHYLTGTATGTWNQASEAAMRRYQADNGWQSKTVPDSRALIKLGLGPSKDNLLNPDSAMTTVPDAPRSEQPAPTSHPAAAVAEPTTPAVPSSTPASSNSTDPQ